MLQAVVDVVARWLTRRPWSVLALVVTLLGLSVWSVKGLRFNTDLFAMAPPEARVVNTFRDVSARFGGNLFVVVHVEEAQKDVLPAAVKDVAQALEASGKFSHVRAEVTAEETSHLREQLRRHVFAYRSPVEEPRMAELLDPEALSKRLRQVKGLLLTPFVSQAAVLRAADPLSAEVLALGPSRTLQVKPGPLVSEDGTAALIFTQPSSYAQNLEFSKSLIGLIGEVDATLAAHPEHPARVDAFGPHITAFQYGGQLQDDLLPSILSSVVGVTLVFFLLYRSFSIAVFTAVALGTGVLLSLAVTTHLVGHVSPFTVGISALLAGTGIDHSVHLFNRYLEERAGGSKAPVSDAIRSVGVGILVAAGTNAFAFLPMVISRFSGIRDFGLAGATGVPLILLSTLLVVPTLMHLKEGSRRPTRGRALGINFPRVDKRRASWIVFVGMMLCLVLAPFAFRIHFDMNINSFRVADPAYEEARDRLMGKFGLSGKTSSEWVLKGADLNALLDQNDAITKMLDRYKGPGHELAHVESLTSVLPGPALQRKRMADVPPEKIVAALDHLNAECAALGLTDTVCDPVRKMLEGGRDGSLVNFEEINSEGLGALLTSYVQQSDGTWMIVGRMYPGEGVEDGSIPEDLAKRIEALSPGATVVGPVRSNEELKDFFHTDLAKVCLLALGGLVLMLILQHPRQPRHLMLALVPVSMGLFVFMGLASALGFDFGLLSLVTLPLVVGVSVDSAVHLTHHLDTDKSSTIQGVLDSTGRAVLVCSVSNAIGCASNALTSNPQVREMGILSAMGVVCCLVASLTVWPALAVLLFPHRQSHGRIDPEADELPEAEA